ncbi:MAG: iron-sulfur cluster assembly scaffold protein [Patescibacteria group bacterium]|nr:iron-sulfur cluster assembly scaffold protein [Patescibacteria group bacterium]
MEDKNNKQTKGDVVSNDKYKEESWVYSGIVKDHFFNPRNILLDSDALYEADGIGVAGSPACGDMMTVWIKINPETKKIKECKWRTFGCASAIASTSMMSVMVTENGGMDIKEAINLKPQQILERLGGLPDRKFHCSVLGHIALRESINDYLKKNGSAKK